MLKKLASWLLYKRMKWKKEVTIDFPDKFIICLAPHTSNWDFLIGLLYSRAEGIKSNFLMKKEWFFWPLDTLFRSLGGIPVVRNRHQSLTDQLADIAKREKYFNLAVTPEGTRSRVTTWKRGFYYIALKANIPIQLFAIDAKHKRIVCTEELMPTGDVEADMKRIMDYYRPYADCAFHPQKFALEEF